MKKTITFDYDIREKIRIIAINQDGRVDAMSHDSLSNQYRIIYWNDVVRHSTWMYDWEITSISKES